MCSVISWQTPHFPVIFCAQDGLLGGLKERSGRHQKHQDLSSWDNEYPRQILWKSDCKFLSYHVMYYTSTFLLLADKNNLKTHQKSWSCSNYTLFLQARSLHCQVVYKRKLVTELLQTWMLCEFNEMLWHLMSHTGELTGLLSLTHDARFPPRGLRLT